MSEPGAGMVFTIPEGYRADQPGRCRSCDAAIMWAWTRLGRRAPLNPDGTSHFATCPQAAQWRKRKEVP